MTILYTILISVKALTMKNISKSFLPLSCFKQSSGEGNHKLDLQYFDHNCIKFNCLYSKESLRQQFRCLDLMILELILYILLFLFVNY